VKSIQTKGKLSDSEMKRLQEELSGVLKRLCLGDDSTALDSQGPTSVPVSEGTTEGRFVVEV